MTYVYPIVRAIISHQDRRRKASSLPGVDLGEAKESLRHGAERRGKCRLSITYGIPPPN